MLVWLFFFVWEKISSSDDDNWHDTNAKFDPLWHLRFDFGSLYYLRKFHHIDAFVLKKTLMVNGETKAKEIQIFSHILRYFFFLVQFRSILSRHCEWRKRCKKKSSSDEPSHYNFHEKINYEFSLSLFPCKQNATREKKKTNFVKKLFFPGYSKWILRQKQREMHLHSMAFYRMMMKKLNIVFGQMWSL